MDRKKYLILAAIILVAAWVLSFVINPVLSTVGLEDSKLVLNFAKVVCFITIALILLFIYLAVYKKVKLHRLVFAMILAFGLLFITIFTPISAPDETHHWQSAWVNVSIWRGEENIQKAEAQYFNYDGYKLHEITATGYARNLKEMFSKKIANDEIIDVPGSYSVRFPGSYLIPSIGLFIARLFNANFFWAYFSGRFTQLLFYAICCALAVKLAPKYKLLFAVVSLFPMGLQQATSYSYDNVINACCVFLVAYILKLSYEKGKFTFKEWLILFLFFMLSGPVKAQYGLLAFAIFFIPKARFDNKMWKKLLILVPTLVVIAVISYIGYFRWATAAASSYTEGSEAAIYYAQEFYTKAWVSEHPAETIMLYLNTLLRKGGMYVADAIGSSMSGLTISINPLITIAFFVFGFIGMYANKKKDDLELSSDMTIKAIQRILFIALLLIITYLMHDTMLTSYTPFGSRVIIGVQGRYYFSLLPTSYLALYIKKWEIKKDISKSFISAISILAGLTVTELVITVVSGNNFSYTFLRNAYHIFFK